MRGLLWILALTLALAVAAGLWVGLSGPAVPQGAVLVLDLEGDYVEAPAPPLLARLFGPPTRPFAELLSEIGKAGRDARLGAIVLRIRDLDIGYAKAQELREAIREARERGRRTVAYLEMGSFGANLEYYLASAADQVYVSPATRAPLVGLAAQYLFLGGLWEKLGIEIEVERIGRYKSAAETIAGRRMSDATREMVDALLDSMDAQLVAGIAEGRKLPPESVRQAIDAAAIDPSEMVRWGLADGVLQLDEVVAQLGGERVKSEDYARVDPETVGFDPVARFALVYGAGNVVVGRGSLSPDGTPVLASDTVSEALSRAAEDPDVAAIIFRVDSPGGSPLASDIVWRATEKAREHGKPLIASFSDVAASGGYYVAAGADAVVASPASITGSIGVFVLRPVLGGALDKLAIGHATLTRGRHADLQLSIEPLSSESRERLRAEVESIYALFVQRVADGRHLTTERVDAVGRGRVWTGAQAHEAGLVDVLGGLRTAVQEAKRRVGIAVDADVLLVPYPPPRSLFEQVADALTGARAAWLPEPAVAALGRARPWLDAVQSGAPMALLPFSLEVR